MNNEEKILELLARHEDSFEKIDKTLSALQAGMAGVKDKLEEVDQRSIRTQVLLETEIRDKIQLLFDGHELIKDKLNELAPKSRVEDFEDDVAMLKDVVKLMRIEIAELKKAQ